MKDKIQKMYVNALNEDLPPNVFADQVLRLFNVIGRSEQLTAFNEWLDDNHHSFKIPDMILQDYISYGG